MFERRNQVADMWDGYISAWIEGEDALERWFAGQSDPLTAEFKEWQASYRGTGRGSLDLDCFPDPFTGDLRGVKGEPRLVVLGLNPGVGYPELQGREDGKWTKRISHSSYSRCFDRSPPGDSDWLELYGGESAYWQNLIRFGKLWCGKEFTFERLLNFELYPWHSNCLTAGLDCPPSTINRYVFEPLAEVATDHVFAFGRAWLDVCRNLDFSVVCRFGEGGTPIVGESSPGWTVIVFQSPRMATPIVVSWQKGYAGPPSRRRLPTFRRILESVPRKLD